MIEKQNNNQLKEIKKITKQKNVLYLREWIDKLFKIYPKYFDKVNVVALKKLKVKQNSIKLFTKICLTNSFLLWKQYCIS